MRLLHRSYFAPLRQMREDALSHLVTFSRMTMVRDPVTGEYVEGPVEEVSVPGLLVSPSAEVREQAAAIGVAVNWCLKLRVGERADVGDEATVEGETDGNPWTRTVQVTGDLGQVAKVNRRFTCIDTTLSGD
jgi:hypothetical protein